MRLIAMGESVRVRMCQKSAHNCICEPAMEIINPAHKKGESRRCLRAGGRIIGSYFTPKTGALSKMFLWFVFGATPRNKTIE